MTTDHSRIPRRRTSALTARAVCLAAGVVASVAGCSGDTATTDESAALDPARAYWRLALARPAVLMSTAAPYDTLQLTPVLYDARGVPLSRAAQDSAVVVYAPADPTDTNVVVSRTGVVRALHPTTRAVVRVRATAQGVTRTDSAVVAVTDETHPPRLARLSLVLTPSDTVYFFDNARPLPMLTASVLDDAGRTIPGAVVAFRSADTLAAQLFGGDDTSRMTGPNWPPVSARRVALYAMATAYGVTRTDSAVVTVTWPYFATVNVHARTPRGSSLPVGYFSPDTVFVAAGATVMWSIATDAGALAADVIFDNPARVEASTSPFAQFCGQAADRGNIAPFTADSTSSCTRVRFRGFPVPGTYPYHSRRYGTAGAIVVR